MLTCTQVKHYQRVPASTKAKAHHQHEGWIQKRQSYVEEGLLAYIQVKIDTGRQVFPLPRCSLFLKDCTETLVVFPKVLVFTVAPHAFLFEK